MDHDHKLEDGQSISRFEFHRVQDILCFKARARIMLPRKLTMPSLPLQWTTVSARVDVRSKFVLQLLTALFEDISDRPALKTAIRQLLVDVSQDILVERRMQCQVIL